MRRITATFGCLIVLALSAGELNAGLIKFTAKGTFALASGTDTLGLDGQKYEFMATFNDGATYQDLRFAPTIFEDPLGSNTLQILGGSAAGTYASSLGISFRPTMRGQIFSGNPSLPNQVGNVVQWRIGPQGNELVMETGFASQKTGIVAGNAFKQADFGAAIEPSFRLADPLATYSVTGFSVSTGLGVTGPVPEPTSLAIFGLGALCAVGVARRRRRVA